MDYFEKISLQTAFEDVTSGGLSDIKK